MFGGKFACEECGERFTFELQLKGHMKKHSEDYNEKKFKCDYCTPDFAFKCKGGELYTEDKIKRHVHRYHPEHYDNFKARLKQMKEQAQNN